MASLLTVSVLHTVDRDQLSPGLEMQTGGQTGSKMFFLRCRTALKVNCSTLSSPPPNSTDKIGYFNSQNTEGTGLLLPLLMSFIDFCCFEGFVLTHNIHTITQTNSPIKQTIMIP